MATKRAPATTTKKTATKKTATRPPLPTRATAKSKAVDVESGTKMPDRRRTSNGKNQKDSPVAQLGMARATLARVQAELSRQMQFRENNNWDCEAEGGIYDRLEALTQIFDEKGLTAPRDLEYDWLGFAKEVRAIGTEITEGVAQHLTDKATRMIVGRGRLTDDQANKLWQEACDEGEKPHDTIRGFSRLIANLRAAGCVDPEEAQLRGGRQQGGHRRR